jgi:putative Mg2+ transporter-C (MgtC) family protein
MDWQTQLDVVGTVAYAMLLGGLVGFDRERKNRPAGFRTHMLVAAAAALLVGMGRLMVDERLAGPADGLQIDPLRLVEAVVAGVAFIGAGTIFSQRQGRTVSGITTAASLLMVAVIGIAAGLGYHVLAAAATGLTLVVLAGLKLLERHWRDRRGGPG